MRIAVVGDSFTEGLGDDNPDGTPRGWADRVAEGLASQLDEQVFYANFAIRGRLLSPIVHEQLDAALALEPKPDLIILNGGGNDMMRPAFSVRHVMELTQIAIDKCRAAGVKLVLVSGANPPEDLPFTSVMGRRGTEYLAATRALVAAEGTVLISNWEDDETHDRRYWADDRLHLGALGHARVASVILTGLGYPTSPPDAGNPAAERSLRGELRYGRVHVLPFIGRRIARKSSGDGRSPKHPTWTLVDPVL